MKKNKRIIAVLLAVLLVFSFAATAAADDLPADGPLLSSVAFAADGISVEAQQNDSDRTAHAAVAGEAHTLLITAAGAETVEFALTEGAYVPYDAAGAEITLQEGDNTIWIRLTGSGNTAEYTVTVTREASGGTDEAEGQPAAQPMSAVPLADDPNDVSISKNPDGRYVISLIDSISYTVSRFGTTDGTNFSGTNTGLSYLSFSTNNPCTWVLKDSAGNKIDENKYNNISGGITTHLPLIKGSNQFTLEILPENGDTAYKKTYYLTISSTVDNVSEVSIQNDDGYGVQLNNYAMTTTDGINFSGTAEDGWVWIYVEFNNLCRAFTVRDSSGQIVEKVEEKDLVFWFQSSWLPLKKGVNTFTLEVLPGSGDEANKKTYNFTVNSAVDNLNDASIRPVKELVENVDQYGLPIYSYNNVEGFYKYMMTSSDGVNYTGIARDEVSNLRLYFNSPYCTATMKDSSGKAVPGECSASTFDVENLSLKEGSNKYTIEVLPRSGNENYKKTYYLNVYYGNRPKGDIIGTGTPSIRDFAVMAVYLRGMRELNAEQLKAADFNNDSKVDIRDFALFAKMLRET